MDEPRDRRLTSGRTASRLRTLGYRGLWQARQQGIRAAGGVAAALEARVREPVPDRPGRQLAVVFLRWDPQRSAAGFARLSARLRTLRGWTIAACVVDNRRSGGAPEVGVDDVPVIAGDNSAREFSGYEAGRRFLLGSGVEPAVWIFANDRYDAYHDLLPHLSTGGLDVVDRLGALAGHIDAYPETTDSYGLDVTSWVATSFVVIAGTALDSVGTVVGIDQAELNRALHVDHAGDRNPFREDGPVGRRHATYLMEWLTGPDSASHHLVDAWYRRLELAPDTWDEFRAKVQCILNEQLLSARCRAAGVPVLPLDLVDRLGGLPREHPAVVAALDELRHFTASTPPRLAGPRARIELALRVLRGRRRD